jgi:hypothetical protein
MMKMMKVGTWNNRAKSHGGKGLSKEKREWFLSFFLEREKWENSKMDHFIKWSMVDHLGITL